MAETKKQRLLVLTENWRKREDATDEEAAKILEKAVRKFVMDSKNMIKSPSHPGKDNDMQTPNACTIVLERVLIVPQINFKFCRNV